MCSALASQARDRVFRSHQYKKEVAYHHGAPKETDQHAAGAAAKPLLSNSAARASAIQAANAATQEATDAPDRGWQVSEVSVKSSTACTFTLARQSFSSAIAAQDRRVHRASLSYYTDPGEDVTDSDDGRLQQDYVRDVRAALGTCMQGRSAGMEMPKSKQRLRSALVNAGMPDDEEDDEDDVAASKTGDSQAQAQAIPDWLQSSSGRSSPTPSSALPRFPSLTSISSPASPSAPHKSPHSPSYSKSPRAVELPPVSPVRSTLRSSVDLSYALGKLGGGLDLMEVMHGRRRATDSGAAETKEARLPAARKSSMSSNGGKRF